MAIERVDVYPLKVVDLSIAKCKRLPKGKWKTKP